MLNKLGEEVDIYIHLGCPKCASTMLQMLVFPKIENFYYLGKRYGSQDVEYLRVEQEIDKIAKQDCLFFDVDACKSVIENYVKKYCNRKRLLLSSEAFTMGHRDRSVIFNRLKSIFPSAKVFIIIREQFESIFSMYSYVFTDPGGHTNSSFGRPSTKSLDSWLGDQILYFERSYISSLLYSSLLIKITSIFDSVEVILYEELFSSRSEFSNNLSRALGVEPFLISSERFGQRINRGATGAMRVYARVRNSWMGKLLGLNRFRVRPILQFVGLSIGARKQFKIRADLKDQLQHRFEEDNHLLQEKFVPNLDKVGWSLAGSDADK